MAETVFKKVFKGYDTAQVDEFIIAMSDKYGENEIVMVLQKGYRIGDRVVRYAMVQVAN